MDEMKTISKKKCEFLFNNFGKMIKINDNIKYRNTSTNNNNEEDNI